MNPHIEACDAYLGERCGRYEWRCVRYDAAMFALVENGVEDSDTVCDVGAGWTEFGARMYTTMKKARPRYFPVDGGLDGTDLELWVPPRRAEFFVALELLEHLDDPFRLVSVMQRSCGKAIVVSTPNPETTDVLGMDRTHKTPIHRYDLMARGFKVEPRSFYGKPDDSLYAVWTPRKENTHG
jgi:hypothetical protein